jgi:hypothetical protein
MRSRKSLLSSVAILLVIGFAGLTHLMAQPRFQIYHSVDIVQLLGSGMCFGVALAMLGVIIFRPRVS